MRIQLIRSFQSEESLIPTNLSDGAVQMTGTPVSIGTVKARVCVAEDITEADDIQVWKTNCREIPLIILC